jgi:hypothetical protein
MPAAISDVVVVLPLLWPRCLLQLNSAACTASSCTFTTSSSCHVCCRVCCFATHLQVAAYASRHIQVLKQTGDDGRVVTCFKQLSTAAQRQAELADMLGLGLAEGMPLAAEMLAAAHGTAHQQEPTADAVADMADAAEVSAAAGVVDSSDGAVFSIGDTAASEGVSGGSAAVAAAASAGSSDEPGGCLQSASDSSSKSNGSSGSNGLQASSAQCVESAAAGAQLSSSSSSVGAAADSAAAGGSRWLMGLSAAAAAAGVAAANDAEQAPAAAQHGVHVGQQDRQ